MSYRWPLHAYFAAALLFSSLAPRSARAEPDLLVSLDYRVDSTLSECPSDTQFRAMIVAQLGYDPFRAGSAYTVVARAHAEPQAIRGFIEWQDAAGAARGKRELSSENLDCPAFARSMSFAIAVQIQLFGEESAGTTSATPQAPERSVVVPPPAAAPAADRARAQTPAIAEESGAALWRFAAGVGPAIGLGLAPAPAFEGRIFAALRHRSAALELGAEASAPARHETADREGFEQQVAFGSLAACAWLRAISGCLVNKWGRLQVRGFGVDVPRAPAGMLVQLGPRVALSQFVGNSWFGALRAEALVTLAPFRVTLDEREVWKTPLFSLALGADLGVVFR